jgi:hypothetical protein
VVCATIETNESSYSKRTRSPREQVMMWRDV